MKYYVVINADEYNYYSKEYDTREEAEAVARVIREGFDLDFQAVEVEAR